MSIVYGHRNGEMESPTELGRYWLQGTMTTYEKGEFAYASDVEDIVELYPHHRNIGYEHWVVYIHEQVHALKDTQGKWWGPVFAPWEVE